MSPWVRRATALSLGAFALSMVALSSSAEPATAPDTSTPATTTTTVRADAAAAAALTPGVSAPASTTSKPTQLVSKPAPTVPLTKQTFTVAEAVGVNIALKSAIDVHKTVTLKKGQMLVLKSQNGTMIEVDGPYSGKPINHYTDLSSAESSMGFDAKSFAPKGHCSGGGGRPADGPNPDETGGAENQATHCQ